MALTHSYTHSYVEKLLAISSIFNLKMLFCSIITHGYLGINVNISYLAVIIELHPCPL